MSTFYQTRKFRRENAKWQRRLEQEGFLDIERGRHQGTVSQDLSERIHFRTEVADSTTAYYDWAQEMLHTKRFRNGRLLDKHPGRKTIWRLHAEGLTNAEIGRRVRLSRWTIEDLIDRIRGYLKGGQ